MDQVYSSLLTIQTSFFILLILAMSAMAAAVENSEFVIMCMSDSYKRSTYCQAEAEYAFKCKRHLIPLKMRAGYKPDGWLGLMIGSRTYIDFGRFDFDVACEKLMTEINLYRRQNKAPIHVQRSDNEKPVETLVVTSKHVREKEKSYPKHISEKPSSKHTSEKLPVNKNIAPPVIKTGQGKLDFLRKPIDQWTPSDVSDFLLAHHLNHMIPLCEAMNGRALIQLYKICRTHRLRAYSVLKDELKSVHNINISINIYSRFLTVIDDAMNSSKTLYQPARPVPSSSMYQSSTVVTSIPFIPAPYPNSSYDFSIVSDMNALDTLRMVEYYAPQLEILDSLRRRIIM